MTADWNKRIKAKEAMYVAALVAANKAKHELELAKAIRDEHLEQGLTIPELTVANLAELIRQVEWVEVWKNQWVCPWCGISEGSVDWWAIDSREHEKDCPIKPIVEYLSGE